MNNLTLNEALNLLDLCPMAILIIGPDRNIRSCNAAFTALTGVHAGTLDADMQQDLLAPLMVDGALINWVTADGDERWLTVECVPMGNNGVTARCYLDVTEKLRLKKERDDLALQLSDQSLKDAHLTSLLSRHGILVSMGPLVARARRYNNPLSIIAMSIETGQERGPVLHKLSLLLKDQTRWADLVGCNADGAFILVLQEATRDSAVQLVEKLTAKLAAVNTGTADPIIASFGIAQCDKNDDAVSLLERAESALTDAHTCENRTSIAI